MTFLPIIPISLKIELTLKLLKGTLTVLCNNPEVKHLILNDMISLGKESGLKSFEQVNYNQLKFPRNNFFQQFSSRSKTFIFIQIHFLFRTNF